MWLQIKQSHKTVITVYNSNAREHESSDDI